jgi:hypothetical protein
VEWERQWVRVGGRGGGWSRSRRQHSRAEHSRAKRKGRARERKREGEGVGRLIGARANPGTGKSLAGLGSDKGCSNHYYVLMSRGARKLVLIV